LNLHATMGEGNTPLMESVRIGSDLGLRIFFKMEMCNPSGSYKDRFAAAEVSTFLQRGIQACVATSSGNTGAALAAFSARYGISCTILVNEAAPQGKLQQMLGHGARILRIREFITSPNVTRRIYALLEKIARESSIPLVVSAYRYSPAGMRGVENIAGELNDQSAGGLDHVFVPVGGGGLFTAVCRGFSRKKGKRPKVHAVQPEGCSTVVSAFQEGRNEIQPVASTTRISGLSVPFDIDAGIALKELRNSGGRGIAISDEEVLTAQKRLLREEGIWCEPAGAAALAGCLRGRKEGWITPGESVACLVTGHGFKDPDSLLNATRENTVALIDEAEVESQLLEVKV
jgi:threonine synthase